jgi:N-acetylmuramoyl-L-alanine amidase
MTTAAALFRFLGAAALLAAGGLHAENEPAVRVPPSRPAPLMPTRLNNLNYVSLADVAARLGWKSAVAENGRRLTLTDRDGKVEVAMDSREAAINGLRVFLGNAVLVRGGDFFISKIDYERCLAPILRPTLMGVLPGRPKVVALDPGHGGLDDGMENKPLGLKEKILTLDVAQRVKKLLEADGYKVVLTREDDRQLGPDKTTDWKTRSLIANQAKADLLVSIHFNSLFPDTKTSGTEVFTFTRSGQRSDQSWSFGEKDDTETDAAPVNAYDPWSSLLAQMMHREVIGHLKTFDRGQKTKHLGMLRGLNCPGILVESVFLSNDAEAKRAATPEYRQQIAEAITNGIRAYAAALEAARPPVAKPPATTTPAPAPGPTTSK